LKPPRRILATLIYAVRGDQVLMLHRNKEPNLGLWVAPGGKLEFDESPEECALRELLEETGLRGRHPRLRAIITEVSSRADYQWLMFVFITDQIEGAIMDYQEAECSEGTLAWVPIAQVPDLAIPQADAIFFPQVMGNGPLFRAKFIYDDQLGIVSWDHYQE
jgi:8-oxo-dGTP diphosphatase